jgi:UDP-glucose 4-epimerase
MKKCCIIGGAGFIGQHLVRQLSVTGRQLIVIDKNKILPESVPDRVTYTQGDYGKSIFLKEVLKDVDEIILLAHTTIPQTSYDDPVKDILGNVPEAVNLFEIASGFGVKKVVFVSSGGTVYGKAKQLPITEEHSTNPISPYGISKLTIEKYGLMYNELKGLPVVSVRPGNAYGEGQKPFSGQGFIAAAIARILKQQDIIFFGENGTIRDYIHVSDVSMGIIAALDRGTPGLCYNIGSGVGRSNREVLDTILPHAVSAGLKIGIQVLPERRFDVPVNVLDCEKIREDTGWIPLVSFEEGIQKTWNWFCTQFYE